jgi:hypothetical protein
MTMNKAIFIRISAIAALLLILGFGSLLLLSKDRESNPTPHRSRTMHATNGPIRSYASEIRSSRIEHSAIINAILRCHHISDVNGISKLQLKAIQYSAVDATDGTDGDNRNVGGMSPVGTAASVAPNTELSNTDLSLSYLSRALMVERANTARSMNSAYNAMIIWQAIVISAGAVATIIVSISSRAVGIQADSSAKRFISVAAVIASAFATAVASMSTFVGAQGAYATDLKTLASLRQMHAEIATLVPSGYDDKYCSQPPDQDKVKTINSYIQQWATRFSTIVGGASSSSQDDAKSSDTQSSG